MPSAIKDTNRQAIEWEANNVYGAGYFRKGNAKDGTAQQIVRRQGYDVIRISPGVTTRFGQKYRAVYGGAVELLFNDRREKKTAKGILYPVRINWSLRGYVKATAKPGSKLLISGIPALPESLKQQMMVR